MSTELDDWFNDPEANAAISERFNDLLLDASRDEEDGYCLVCVRPYHGHGPHVRDGELRWMRADPDEQTKWTQHYIPSVNETIMTAVSLFGDLALERGPDVLNVWGYKAEAS